MNVSAGLGGHREPDAAAAAARARTRAERGMVAATTHAASAWR
jgi:hypothetical protein